MAVQPGCKLNFSYSINYISYLISQYAKKQEVNCLKQRVCTNASIFSIYLSL